MAVPVRQTMWISRVWEEHIKITFWFIKETASFAAGVRE